VNSIGAHLTVAAVAVSRWIEQAWTARYRTIKIQVHTYTITPPTRYPATCATPSTASTGT
jgi:hypothetical protein